MPVEDLTRRVESGMFVYPGDPEVSVEPHATVAADGCRVSRVALGSHAGTHVDAPSHTEPAGRSLGDVPVETFRFEAVVADLRPCDARAALSPADLPLARADDAGADMLVLHTGWDAHWGEPRARDHPYLTAEAAAACAARDLHVGTDALGVDPTPGGDAGDAAGGLDAHHALLGNDRLIVENLTRLDAVPERLQVDAYPLALDADGAPVRAVGRF
ncbi:MAG: cyclase family protein [Haloferacaceae archaeon]